MSRGVTEDIRQQRTRILPVSFLMLLVATMHIIILWVRGVLGFIVQKRGSTQAFYEDISDPTTLIKVSCMCLQMILGDAVVVWRLYVVYDKQLLVVIPAILLVTIYTAVACVTNTLMAKARPGTDIFHVAKSWITAYFSLTMSTNVICSGAIAWRIYLVGKPLRRTTSLWPIIFIIVESSALYAIGVTAALASFLSGSNGQYIAVEALVPLVGIVFSLIVLQIRFHIDTTTTTSSGSKLPQRGAWGRQSLCAGSGEELEFHVRPRSVQMAVHISKQTHTYLSAGEKSRDPSPDYSEPITKP
ncbi:hypothetical protein BGW80DRAFT_1459239 [Lactifluus volemus]|nr:hypothetical protein BGW80DRAFT_1459239 [Lactifluus volemus]